jgi:lysyl-tRNA synthetase class 2
MSAGATRSAATCSTTRASRICAPTSKSPTRRRCSDENRLIAERREKLAAWRASGKAFPNDFLRENTAGKLDELYAQETARNWKRQPVDVKVAGRIMLKRVMGKASFATIQDLSGRIQLYVSNDDHRRRSAHEFKHWDIGDIVGCEGTLFKTKTGELTIKAASSAC